MVYRFSWLAGGAAIALALLRLTRLIRPTESGPPWVLALVAAAVLGIVITWILMAYKVSLPGLIGANLLALLLAVIRIGAPDTAAIGILPTWRTFEVLSDELTFAVQVIRFGSAPVVPLSGLIVILAIIFWLLGAVVAWGLIKGKPAVALVPPVLFYLQLATIDRARPGIGWTIAALGLVAFALLAIGLDERRAATGRLRRLEDASRVAAVPAAVPATFIVVPILIGVLAMGFMAGWVSDTGAVNWRRGGGLGGGIVSGVSYNLVAGILQDGLVANSETEVFRAKVSGDISPGEVYFKLINLEHFDGEHWLPGPASVSRPADGETWGDPAHRHAGNSTTVVQSVTISSLQMNYLPALPQPRQVASPFRVLEESFRIRDDGSLKIDLLTFPELTYDVVSDYTLPSFGQLATLPSGDLSPIFAKASADGAFREAPATGPAISAPEDITEFLELPADIDPRLAAEARFAVANGATPFERGALLESYFQNTGEGGFTYSTDAEGHGASDLVAWLFDPLSPNFRTGYCEQFATAMAVMARGIGVPSRVVLGFVPGDVQGDEIIVREKHGHAWVELWIDQHGWVRFDPTPRSDGQNAGTTAAGLLGFNPADHIPPPPEEQSPEAIRTTSDEIPLQFQIIGDEDIPIIPFGEPAEPFRIPLWSIVVLVVVVGVSVVPVWKLLRRRRRLARLSNGDISAAWEELVDRLTDYGNPVPGHQTPYELADDINPSMEPLAREYARFIYGPDTSLPERAVAIAERSFQDTNQHLAGTHTLKQRIWSWLKPDSLRSG